MDQGINEPLRERGKQKLDQMPKIGGNENGNLFEMNYLRWV